MYFTTAIAIAAGVSVAFGILYLFIGLRRTSQQAVNLLFAFFSLAYAGAILGARASYLADSLDQYATASRVSAFFAAFGFTLLVWFVAAYTEVRSNLLLIGITAAFAVIALASVFAPSLVVDVSGGVREVTFSWGETILMDEAEEPPLLALYLLALLASLAYISVATIVLFRRGARGDAAVLAIGVVWLVFTLVQENLAQVGVTDSVFLSDFGFLGFVLAMSLASANRAIETEAVLRNYQTNLQEAVDERTAKLQAAQEQLVAQAEEQAASAERSRLARDLHDVVTQLLFSINLIASSLPRLWRSDPEMAARSTEQLQRLTRGALAEMRTLLRELRPHTIAETELATLVTQLTDGRAARHDIPAEVHTEIRSDLPTEVHLAFYRIAQEAMNNVAKHANASSLVVDLTGENGRVHLSILDDGLGFDAATVSADHMGLDIMRERASGIGADLTVTSAPNDGTAVKVSWDEDADA